MGEEEVRAHRWLLSARCEPFGRMLCADNGCVEGATARAEVRDCSAAAFKEFIKWVAGRGGRKRVRWAGLGQFVDEVRGVEGAAVQPAAAGCNRLITSIAAARV